MENDKETWVGWEKWGRGVSRKIRKIDETRGETR